METSEYLTDTSLPGWPGRTEYMLTTGGTHIFHFVIGEDQVIPITDTYSTTIRAENRFNHLRGKSEKLGYEGDLSKYYPDFIYGILGNAQKRVIACLHGEKEGHYQTLFDSYIRFRNCTQGKGKKNFAQ